MSPSHLFLMSATALAVKPELAGEPIADGMYRVVQYA